MLKDKMAFYLKMYGAVYLFCKTALIICFHLIFMEVDPCKEPLHPKRIHSHKEKKKKKSVKVILQTSNQPPAKIWLESDTSLDVRPPPWAPASSSSTLSTFLLFFFYPSPSYIYLFVHAFFFRCCICFQPVILSPTKLREKSTIHLTKKGKWHHRKHICISLRGGLRVGWGGGSW